MLLVPYWMYLEDDSRNHKSIALLLRSFDFGYYAHSVPAVNDQAGDATQLCTP